MHLTFTTFADYSIFSLPKSETFCYFKPVAFPKILWCERENFPHAPDRNQKQKKLLKMISKHCWRLMKRPRPFI